MASFTLVIACLLASCFALTSAQSGGTCNLDLVFVIDSSGSINENDDNNWGRVLTFVGNITDQFSISQSETQVGIVVYSDLAEIVWFLDQSTNRNAVLNAINDLDYMGGNTNTADGILKAYTEVFDMTRGDRPNVKNVMIVITDGESNERVGQAGDEADAARAEDDVGIIVIGVSDQVDENELNHITSNKNNMRFLVPDFNSFNQKLITRVAKTSCNC